MTEEDFQLLLSQHTTPAIDIQLGEAYIGPTPGSLLCDRSRPPSPHNMCDFPFFQPIGGDDSNKPDRQTTAVPVRVSTTHMLPAVPTTREDMLIAVTSMSEEMDSVWENITPQQVDLYDVLVAGLGSYGQSLTIHRTSTGCFADTGANCSMTAQKDALINIEPLNPPVVIGLAVSPADDPTPTAVSHMLETIPSHVTMVQ